MNTTVMRWFCFAVLCAAWGALSCKASRAQAGGAAHALFEAANRERAAHKLGALKWDARLAEAARAHAERMAARNSLSHQFPGESGMAERVRTAGAHFSALAENVAEGPTAERLHEEWMHSPPHRANLLDAEMNSVGIAVAERGGTLFAVEDFSQAVEVLSLNQQEAAVAAPLRSRGLRIEASNADARRSCPMNNGYAGARVPAFVLHYATPDLATLPDILEQRIRTGKYRSASVGACAGDNRSGFSGYRIAVLLFDEPR